MRRVGGDHPEAIVVELGHGEIGFEATGLIEPLGVGDDPSFAVYAIGRDPLECTARIRPLHEEFRHERHVHKPDALTDCAMLLGPVGEPVLPAPGQCLHDGFDARGCEPVGALPAGHIAEVGTRTGQAIMDRGALDSASGLHRLAGEVGLVHHAERLDRACGAVLRRRLVGVQSVDVHAGDIDVGEAVDDPRRDRAADAAAREDADRVESGGDEVAPDLR